MTVDADIVAALKESLRDLGEAREDCLGAGAIAALSRVARPGLRVRIDLEASREIGAPLVTMSRDTGVELFEMLTPRQAEVAELIVAGQSNRDIAKALGISIGTVKDHVHAILQRLGMPSRQAVMAAARGFGAG